MLSCCVAVERGPLTFMTGVSVGVSATVVIALFICILGVHMHRRKLAK